MVPVEVAERSFSAGQEAERIRLHLQGSYEEFYLLLGDRIRVEDLKGHSGSEQDTHDTRVGGTPLLVGAGGAFEAVVALSPTRP